MKAATHTTEGAEGGEMADAITVNAGSSSVRLARWSLEGPEPRLLRTMHHERGDASPLALAREMSEARGDARIAFIAHRVVHGGTLHRTVLVDAEVERAIEEASQFAPLHNPAALLWLRAFRETRGRGVPQVAVFDTAFFATLPDRAKLYALPYELAERHGLYRRGFHGLAHQSMWQRWRELNPEALPGARVISIQLGSGASIAAIRGGTPIDTSMGFSPLEGLVMATRPGDLDAGVLLYLLQRAGMSIAELDRTLNEASGLRGVSGTSGDLRQLLGSDDDRSRLAVELYVYRARKYVGAYLAALGGADAILFGGGVGENMPEVRARILAGMEFCGIELDAASNAGAVGRAARVTSAASRIEVWVVPIDESEILVREAMAAIAAEGVE